VTTSPDDMLALADAFFVAVETGDLDGVRRAYADDALIWHNNDDREQSLEENLVVLAWMARHVPDRRYTEIRRYVFDDGAGRSGVIQQHVLTGTGASGALHMPAMIRLDMTSDDAGVLRITRLEEYLDSAHVAVLRPAP
jgi:uncharacterized protein